MWFGARDGTTHVIFEPPDFIVWLAAHSTLRAAVTPSGRGKGSGVIGRYFGPGGLLTVGRAG